MARGYFPTMDHAALPLDATRRALAGKPSGFRSVVVDINGDGKITPADRTRVGGSAFADTQFGFNTAMTYKNFDFYHVSKLNRYTNFYRRNGDKGGSKPLISLILRIY